LIAELAPRDLAAWRADPAREPPVVVDVREPWEYARCHLDDSRLLPLQTVPANDASLPRDRDLVLERQHGGRSLRAAQWLEQRGYTRLHNLTGGVDRWATDVDPSMPRY
jgi:rhodanese-related sulfurtransferase